MILSVMSGSTPFLGLMVIMVIKSTLFMMIFLLQLSMLNTI